MTYKEIKIKCPIDFSEILMAELGVQLYDSFMETEEGFNAYILLENYDKKELKAVLDKYGIEQFEVTDLEKKNWNKEWEKNYDSIAIDNKCLIRASFHPSDKSFEHEIVINPKMSFGTGHHATTAMMVKQQLQINFLGKKVLDAGSGTGILSIMASKLGAESIQACDIEEWAVENSLENFKLNNCTNINVIQGTVADLMGFGKVDILLANINKNVLLEEMYRYVSLLANNGILVLSGFYQEDILDISQKAAQFKLIKKTEMTQDKWASASFLFEG